MKVKGYNGMSAGELVDMAMLDLSECMPCGGIGDQGATLSELDGLAENGTVFDGSAEYHSAQHAWRLLQMARRLMRRKRK